MDHSIIMIHFVIVAVDRFYENFIVIGNIIVISLSTFAFVENARHYDDQQNQADKASNDNDGDYLA